MGAMEFQCVKSRLTCQLCGNAELLHYLMNTLYSEVIGSLHLVGLIKKLCRHKAAVPDLDTGLAALVVNRLGDLFQLISLVLIVKAKIESAVALRAHAGYLHNVQAAAACCSGRMIGRQIIADIVLILDHFGVHAWHDNTVFKFKTSDLDGGKQCIVAHKKYTLSFKIICFLSLWGITWLFRILAAGPLGED